MWVDPFEVSEHDVSVETVLMLDTRVLNDGVSDVDLVFAHELPSAPGAGLLVLHRTQPTGGTRTVRQFRASRGSVGSGAGQSM